MNALIEWPTAPSDLTIEAGAVHVWAWDFKCSDEELKRHIALLSLEEQARMRRFYFERDRVRYAVSHSVLRRVLGYYLDLHPTLVSFTTNKFGKPKIIPTLNLFNLRFNLSHTNRMALLAITSDLEVGVDLEELRFVEAEIAERYFSERERIDLGLLAKTEWLQGFYNCWTRKEAILKAEGIGLNVKLDAFDVTLRPGDFVEMLGFKPAAGLTTSWHLSELRPGLGFVGALATSAAPKALACFHFTG